MEVEIGRMQGREAYKKAQYRLVDAKYEEAGLGGICLLCSVGVPGGQYRASGHHEVVSKARLPGVTNWDALFSPENIVLACAVHHQALGQLPLVWMKSAVAKHLAREEQYRVKPFLAYWEEGCYPCTTSCIGKFGYGSHYFLSGKQLPDPLRRLYQLENKGFDEGEFCRFCRELFRCKMATSLLKE